MQVPLTLQCSVVGEFPVSPLYSAIAGLYSLALASHTVQLLLPDWHSITETRYGTSPHHRGVGALVTFSSAVLELPFGSPFQLAAHVAVLGQWTA